MRTAPPLLSPSTYTMYTHHRTSTTDRLQHQLPLPSIDVLYLIVVMLDTSQGERSPLNALA